MKTKQERIALGWEKNLSQGIIPARACYGLRKFVPRHTGQKKRLYWNEREIAVVKKVFALAAGGMHYTRIPQHLGLTDMAFGWATIKNPVYTGRYYDRHTKKWYRLKITPVIDDDTWLKVNAQIKSVNPRHIYPPWPNEAPA
jgi:hypothetical protein